MCIRDRIRDGQIIESNGVGAGAGESPQPALISASNASSTAERLRGPEIGDVESVI